MLDKVGGSMTDVGVVVRASHERWDGGGYPDGTAGEAHPAGGAHRRRRRRVQRDHDDPRPTGARSRPRPRSTELQACAGTQFDPEVVDALTRVLAHPPPATPAEFLALASLGEPPSARPAAPYDEQLLAPQVEQPGLTLR